MKFKYVVFVILHDVYGKMYIESYSFGTDDKAAKAYAEKLVAKKEAWYITDKKVRWHMVEVEE